MSAGTLFVKNYDVISANYDLSPQAKDLYAFFQRMQFQQDKSDFTHGQLANVWNVCTRTIRNWIKELREHGLLEVIRKRAYCIYKIKHAIDHVLRRNEDPEAKAAKEREKKVAAALDRQPDSYPPARKDVTAVDVSLEKKEDHDVIEVLRRVDVLFPMSYGGDYPDLTDEHEEMMTRGEFHEWMHCCHVQRPFLGQVRGREDYENRLRIARELGLGMVEGYGGHARRCAHSAAEGL